MKITTRQLAQAYFESVKDASEAETKKIAFAFVELLRKRKLLKKKDEVLKELTVIQDREASRMTATIRTAKKLSAEELEHIKRTLKNAYTIKTVVLEEIVDATLIGGADIQIGWEKISGSIKHRLHTLQQSL